MDEINNPDAEMVKAILRKPAPANHVAMAKDILALNAMTSVTVYAGTMASVWLANIIDYAKENLVMRQLAMRDEDALVRQRGTTLYLHKITAPTMTWNTNADDDLNESAKTTSFVTSDVTITPGWQKASMSLSQDILLETPEDVLGAVRNTLAYEMSHKIDADIMADVIGYLNGSTAVEANITNSYIAGQGASYMAAGSYDPSTLTSADKCNPDDILETLAMVETDNFHPNALVIHPIQKKQLTQAPQFSNAAQWGSDAVVRQGQIGTFGGMNVYETTQMGQTPTTSGWGVAGRFALLIDTTKAYVHAPALAPQLNYAIEPETGNSKFYVQMKYKGGTRYQEQALGALACAD